MWYFLLTHPLILNFYYFVNCFTFIFIFYYYYIIFLYLYLYIFLFSLSLLLFSLSSSFFPIPTLTYPPFLPHHEDMPLSPFFHHFLLLLFIFFLPTFMASHFTLPFLLSFLGLTVGWPYPDLHSPHFWISSPWPPPNSDSQSCSLISSLHFFIFFFLPHSTHGRPVPISFPFYFLLQLVPMPISPSDSIITAGGMMSASLRPRFLLFSSSHFFYLSFFIIFISFLFPQNPSTLIVDRSSISRCWRPPPIFSHSLTFTSHLFSIIIIVVVIVVVIIIIFLLF